MSEQRILFEAPKLALTRVEAAHAINVSPATLDRLTKPGLLRPSRATRRPLYSIAEIRAFPAQNDGRNQSGARTCKLKKDNCIRNGRYRSVFVAQENIRLFIWKVGEQKYGSLTVTAADCLETREFQEKWYSYLNALKKVFPTGMWTRERQPRSGNWHAHAAVDVGWDVQTNFPREQVAKGFYANVDLRLRELCKYLRDQAVSRGFGRVELLPLKYSGPACARYFTKYLAKTFASEKRPGEEKCRLFGVWGGIRFVHSRFNFITSRIIQKKKQWFAEQMLYSDSRELTKLAKPLVVSFRQSIVRGRDAGGFL